MKQLICICNKVTYGEIKKILQQHPHYEINEVIQRTQAGLGCGRCKSELTVKVEEIKKVLNTRELPRQLRLPFPYNHK